MSTPIIRVGEIDRSEIEEFTHGDPSMRVDTFSHDKADLTMSFKVPGTKLIPFIQWTLGVAYVEGSRLRRSLPMYHPVHLWCWAKSVQIRGRGNRGPDLAALMYADQVTPAKWEMYDATVTFEMPPYDILGDSKVSAEYQRFVEKTFCPETEVVTVEVGSLLYDANAADAHNGKAWNPGPGVKVLARYEATGVTLKWMKVPWEFLAQDDNSIPLKLMQIVGCVNDAAFLGLPAETLLCRRPPKVNKYPQPIITTSDASKLYFAADIEINLLYRDPTPKGKTNETRHGWNFALGGSTLKYYYARDTDGRPLYRSRSFPKLFTIWSDTYADLT